MQKCRIVFSEYAEFVEQKASELIDQGYKIINSFPMNGDMDTKICIILVKEDDKGE